VKEFKRDLRWIIPTALVLGLGLSLLGPGTWWIGWLAFSLLLAAGLVAISVLWRSSGSNRALGLMLLLAIVLRLGLGIALSYILPTYGNDTPVQNAGYIFSDAYKRDSQAWELATSNVSLLKAFDKSFSVDQYGGLLFISGLLYRLVSPDAQRPWLIILLAALTSGIGVALAYKAACKAWGDRMGMITGWIMALYPEAILLGSSQMREPFLITFLAMMFWGLGTWAENHRRSIIWAASGIVGLLLFSPGVAIAGSVIIAFWAWLDRKNSRISWWIFVGILATLVLAAGLFVWAVSGSMIEKSNFVGAFFNWIRFAVQFDSSVLVKNSGWVQTILSHIPNVLHLPFVIGYGILQPVLPAAIGDIQAVWPMQALGILRGLGWFALLPLLVYFPISLWKMADKRERLSWFCLWLAMAVWTVIASARGGGDQWDNPRYRVIFLLFQAALAAQVLIVEYRAHSHGLLRVVAVEVAFVVCFSAWTISRYDGNPYLIPLSTIAVTFVALSLFLLVGDWLWIRFRGKKTERPRNSNQVIGMRK